MSNPVNVGLYGHRSIPLILNTTTGSTGAADRVQRFQPGMNLPTTQHRELGRVGPVGISQAPLNTRVSLQQNLVDSFELEWILTGKHLGGAAVAAGQSYTMGDLLRYADAIKLYLLNRNQDDTILSELELGGLSVSEVVYTFTVNQAMTLDITFMGRTMLEYDNTHTVHTVWPTLDNTSLGGITGKEARVWLSSGSTPTSRIYRVQSFVIRAAFPFTPVGELGNRNLAGSMSDGPDVSLTFDVLPGDEQPNPALFTQTTGVTDFANPVAPLDAYVRVFDPRLTEGSNVIRAFKIDNVVAQSATPISAQVRGLATSQYSLVSSSEDVADSGGLTVSNKNLGG